MIEIAYDYADELSVEAWRQLCHDIARVEFTGSWPVLDMLLDEPFQLATDVTRVMRL